MMMCKMCLDEQEKPECGKSICCFDCDEKDHCEGLCGSIANGEVQKPEDCAEAFDYNTGISVFQKENAKIIEKIAAIEIQKKQLDAAENQMRDVLKAAMETHGVKSFTSTDGTVAFTYVPATTRTTVDSKRLKAEKPDLFAEYSKESNVAASVRIKVEK